MLGRKPVNQPRADRIDMVDPAHVEPVDRAFIGVQSIGEIADRRKRERAGEAKRAIPISWSEGSGRGHRCLMWCKVAGSASRYRPMGSSCSDSTSTTWIAPSPM